MSSPFLNLTRNIHSRKPMENIDFREAHERYENILYNVYDRAENVRAHCKIAIKELEEAETEEALEEAREHCHHIKDLLKYMNEGVDLALKSHRSFESDEQ